jgi:hypothetical protein
MFSVIFTEFLKLRRSKMLLLSVIASFIPAMIKFLQFAFGKSQANTSWELFLGSGQELTLLAMLFVVVFVSSFVFSMEYQYNTASYVFTSSISKVNIFVSKMISLLAIITFLFIVLASSQLLFGFLALKVGISWTLFFKFIQVIVWYIFSYFLVSAIVVLVAVLIKRFVISAVIVLSYLLLIFPFHAKNNPYICPLMTPTVVASRIYGTSNYIFTNYFTGVSTNSIYAAVILLTVLATSSIIIGMLCYKKSD